MKLLNFFIVLLIQFAFFQMNAQEAKMQSMDHQDPNIYISLSVGVQMSGIKNEDFVSNNIAPLMTFSVGKWFTPLLALQAGYMGNYYKTISDEKKHYYNYFFGQSVFNLNKIVNHKKQMNSFNIFLNVGAGYFYNYDFDRPNICALMGISSNYKLTEQLSINTNISAIMGWDIYQGDQDIIPELSLGLSYLLH